MNPRATLSSPPGLLRANVKPDVLFMICTAGHVDHGKTRLVGLLTGCKTDRLKVEQERGLTIELGFAPCLLGGDLCVGIVDVPGHEKFVRNMVAGVSGISMCILVIAADDGVMPQTIEHLDIMGLLGVRHGIVALTKTDLVSPERVLCVTEEIRAYLKDTFLEHARICPLSSETGDGVFDFYDALVKEIRDLTARSRSGVFRMPIERCFVQKGFGVVVTGIPVSGHISLGDQVVVMPGERMGRIRGIQCFLRDAERGGAGQCLALNIPDFAKDPPERGQVLTMPGYLHGGQCLHVRLRAVTGLEQPIRHAEQAKLHTGTTEVSAKIYLLDARQLQPGTVGTATLVADRPVAVAAHDRLILRRPSPAITIAGGDVLAVEVSPERPSRKQLMPGIAALCAAFESVTPETPAFDETKITYYLAEVKPEGDTCAGIAVACTLTQDETAALLENMHGIIALSAQHYVHATGYDRAKARIRSWLDEARHKATLSLPYRDLMSAWPWPGVLISRILADLEADHEIRVRDRKILLGDPLAQLNDREHQLAGEILRIYAETRFAAPRPDELPPLLTATPHEADRVLGILCDERLLIRFNKNVILSYDCYKTAQNKAVEVMRDTGALDSADFKNCIGTTRKYALAILDFMDARGITLRNDNIRKLARDYEGRLL